MTMSSLVSENVPLAQHTTLAVGGPARYWLEADDLAQVRRGLDWADERDLPVIVLGGGSNMLIADRGLDALVLRVRIDGIEQSQHQSEASLEVGAGVQWDSLVRWAVERDLAGIECLAGIPGEVGATPIQNVGAYGQEVGQHIEQVVAIDRHSGAEIVLDNEACGFAYRDSVFKREARDRFIVTAVRFRLVPGGPPLLAYPELQRAIQALDGSAEPDLARVSRTVVELRRGKATVLDPDDENFRSAGSFFVNPIVEASQAEQVATRARALVPKETMPRYPQADGRVKLAAAWLIERAGMHKGWGRASVGLSTRHSLAIVNRGAASAAEILSFAAEIRRRVEDSFGVSLTPEPCMLGFDPSETASLGVVQAQSSISEP